MNVLIVAPFTSLPSDDSINRFHYLALILAREHSVTLVTSSFNHQNKSHRASVCAPPGISIVLIDEPGYPKNVSLKRLWSHHIFVKNFRMWFLSEAKKKKFECVYSSYPFIWQNIFLGSLKVKYGFELIIDIQDVWPESFASVMPLLSKLPSSYVPFSWLANTAYRSADKLVAVSQTYIDRAKAVNSNIPTKVVFLGSDFDSIRSVTPRSLDSEKFHFLYIGTLSHSYDMETVILAFNRAFVEGKNFILHVAGSGPDLERLRSVSSGNVIFYGYRPYVELISLAKGVDVFINPIKKSAAQSITNKLSDYISVGKPIISSQECDEVKALLARVGAFFYEAGSVDSLSEALALSSDRSNWNSSRREHQLLGEAFDRAITYEDLAKFVVS